MKYLLKCNNYFIEDMDVFIYAVDVFKMGLYECYHKDINKTVLDNSDYDAKINYLRYELLTKNIIPKKTYLYINNTMLHH